MLKARVGAAVAHPTTIVVRQAFPILVVAALLLAYRSELAAIEYGEISAGLAAIGWPQWGAALMATAASFAAIGRYDQLFHALDGNPVSARRARISGMAAIAVSQFTGFGLVTATLVRWRLLPDFGPVDAVRFSARISAAFVLALAALAAVLVLASGIGGATVRAAASAAIVLPLLAPVAFWLRPQWLRRLPPLRLALRVVLLVAADIGFAALAFWALLPGSIDLPFVTFVAAFFGAFLLGLIGATPGGIGPFDAVLLALVPQAAPEPILTTALAFRIVYCVFPSLIGFAAVLIDAVGFHAPAAEGLWRAGQKRDGDRIDRLGAFAHPDRALLAQGQFTKTRINRTVLATARLSQTLVALREPSGADAWGPGALAAMHGRAAAIGRGALIYKCSARSAANARRAGWQVCRIVREAWLDPARFEPSGPAHRQLRRMLRKADAAGVVTRRIAPGACPDALAAVARAWRAAHGGERGFSMGRYDPGYLAQQAVFGAFRHGTLVAFLTVNRTASVWSVDLMRALPDAPAGTMHRLVVAALTDAKARGATAFSLAGVPAAAAAEGEPAVLRALIGRWVAEPGLVRFKTAFAPRWEPLYAAAPKRLDLALGLAEVLSEIAYPRPLPTVNSSDAHNYYDKYEFDSRNRT